MVITCRNLYLAGLIFFLFVYIYLDFKFLKCLFLLWDYRIESPKHLNWIISEADIIIMFKMLLYSNFMVFHTLNLRNNVLI